ncbi:hypothetical protein Acy02nite_83250 [Actinoplanes cyaneus]|uniref:Uncharacterized protein n=1 Tax=Actinoplanes cyaneus TaxID=52696 RepID=A0A919MC97_9ACTN|nr:hypothetical protein [Actinoplanes cyaneus]MCW2143112.1 hypothetical protein [Actinoplanes cyaneus]GID70444.1 hypothetical protein Acy02nite_83250 [Actinoplanes cyaneus]
MGGAEAVVSYHCGTATVSDYVVGGRLRWEVSHGCGDGVELVCGRGELPADLRAAVLAQCGTFGVRFPAGDRVAVMRVLRGRGVPVGELRSVLAQGVTGTEAEMVLLAGQLAAAGVAVVVSRREDPDLPGVGGSQRRPTPP